ncbi:MAG: hypothetical protein ABI761_16070 [Saprospiraceae bacterium]
MKTRKNIYITLFSLLMLHFACTSKDCCKDKKNEGAVCCTSASDKPVSNVSSTAGVNYADLQIIATETSVTEDVSNGTFKLTARIKNDSNNDAQGAKCIVLLPGETNVLEFNAAIQDSIGTNISKIPCHQCSGYLLCDFGHLNRSSVGVVHVTTSRPEKTNAKGQENFALFIYSEVPDTRMEDNSWI